MRNRSGKVRLGYNISILVIPYGFFILPSMSEWYKTKIFCPFPPPFPPPFPFPPFPPVLFLHKTVLFLQQRNRSGKVRLGYNISILVIPFGFFILPGMSEWYKTKIFCRKSGQNQPSPIINSFSL